MISRQIQARTPDERDIPVTRNLLGTPLPTRTDYLARFPERRLILHDVERRWNDRDQEGAVVLAVNHQLLNELDEGFNQFADDLGERGFDVTLLDVEGGTPAEFKELLIEEGGEDLAGVILAGELPLAWFELQEYFDDEDEPDNPRFVQFPVDLFFMDIDGVWQDTSGNGVYDVHAGSWQPDIWVGRLPAYNMSRLDEEAVVSAYLEKVHRYRTGELTLPHRALSYIDDDWVEYSDEWGDDVSLTYGLVNTVAEPDSTSVANYSRELESDGYELVQVCVHSTADTHIFWIDGRHARDYFRFRHLRDDVSPDVMFYNLYACSNMNLATNLPMGALYALGGPCGLGAVGSTKTGSMLYFDDYYGRLGDGDSFGEAFRQWFTRHGNQPGHENWSRSWFYGMTYFGDPTLKPSLGLRVHESIIQDEDGGDGDGSADAGESIDLVIVLTDRSENAVGSGDLLLSSDDPYVEVAEGEGRFDGPNPDEFVPVDGLRLSIAENCTDRHRAELLTRMTPHGAEPWYDRIYLEIFSPELRPVGFHFAEVEGNHDGWVGPGEAGSLTLALTNIGGDDLPDGCRVVVQSLDSLVLLGDGEADLSGVDPGSIGLSRPIGYRVTDVPEVGRGVLLCATVFSDTVRRGGGMFILPLSAEMSFDDSLDFEPVWLNSYPISPGYHNSWRWGGDAGDGTGGIAFGGADSSLYLPHADAALELPLMMFEDDVILVLRHRMAAEGNYDGGMIEINRGDGWELALPDGGYNGTAVDNGSFPGGMCWNGEFDWRTDRIRIEGPPGTLGVRFRFVSDNAVEMEGWFIDHIRLTGTPFEVDDNPVSPATFKLESVYPNPFNNTFNVRYSAVGAVTLRLYDLTGRRVHGFEGINLE
ncbi:MAG TPA: hypothetical protein ENL08_03150, partial [Bacteroidetes bacterium]|nr:hypothetical protein [Bacteroidota bacterium]